MSMAGSSPSSYWCYRCSRFITVPSRHLHSSFSCPGCNAGFIEETDNPTRTATETTLSDSPEQPNNSPPALRRDRATAGDRSAFNPVIILRGPTVDSVNGGGGGGNGFEMYYDDGSGSGLRPLPVSMSDILLGSGFDRLLEQLTQIEVNGLGRVDQNPAASKSAVESLPCIEIDNTHIDIDIHCAVCKEAFELGTLAKEMPCKHLYHSECIIPWLNLRNSCPVCRHELPTESRDLGNGNEEVVGLTIWRLPGGGFAVGRRGRERDIPVVFTEMDGGLNVNRNPVRGPRRNSRGSGTGLRRIFGGVFTCLGGGRRGISSSSSSSSDEGASNRSRFIPAIFSSSSRRRRALAFDANNRPQMW
uniref:E3 ubiquitin-protein ligase RDUF2-like n=1 Tax=Erigeron canadensis TaxID=72917 RepID=UPI001CB99462|nr:E3 ubiquitin-protein ligase RDUF2-like [Erigeron canadensis]